MYIAETLEQKLDKIENEEDKAGLRDEISEIDELLPSIDAKVNILYAPPTL